MRRALVVSLVMGLITVAPRLVRAQQTIFNDPSADVLPAHAAYLELDGTWRFHDGSFEGLVPRLVWGLGSGVEIGLNAGPFVASPSVDPYLVPNLKARLFEAGGATVRLAGVVGTRIYVPVSRGGGFRGEPYGFLALGAGPLRLTGGGYAELRRHDADGGLAATVELRLGGHLTLAFEWWQHQDAGAGVVVALPRGVALYAAYLFSPAGRDHDGVVAEVGWTF